jgi:hypothetical protein
MSIVVTSLLRDKVATILASLALCIFTVSVHFFNNHVFFYFFVSVNFYVYFIIISLLSFCSKSNLDQWYQSRMILIIFQCMSPTRSEYSKLGLALVSLEDNHSLAPKKPSIAKEKKNNGVEDYINLLLEQALMRQRDEMMEKFFHILQHTLIETSTSSSCDHFGGNSPFKVQVNFHIPVFEGQTDADALEKWLNLLEGYFFVHKFSDREKITFALLKALPHVKHWWETYWDQSSTEESGIYGIDPTWDFFLDAFKEQYYPVDNDEYQYMRWTTLRKEKSQTVSEFTNTFHTLRTKLGIKDFEQNLVLKYRGDLHRYIQTEMGFLNISSLGVSYRYVV